MRLKIKKKGKDMEKLLRQLHSFTQQTIQAGHFKEQGEHHSGMSYPELMALHHAAQANGMNFPDRPVLDILFHSRDVFNKPEAANILRRYKDSKVSAGSDKAFLEDLGQYLVSKEKEVFGSGELAPTKAGNPPLVDTGDLRDRTAYKTSIDGQVKEK